MAKRTQGTDPETKAYAIVQKPGGYSLRTYLIRGDEVLAFIDSDMDTYQSTAGNLLNAVSKEAGL